MFGKKRKVLYIKTHALRPNAPAAIRPAARHLP
jgi:hypothetical protein